MIWNICFKNEYKLNGMELLIRSRFFERNKLKESLSKKRINISSTSVVSKIHLHDLWDRYLSPGEWSTFNPHVNLFVSQIFGNGIGDKKCWWW